ncbi:MAG: hypothetical protein H8E59_05980 [Actinobacteria bacterium]|nr:hypothetical protein [Actinomycetota bacterium]
MTATFRRDLVAVLPAWIVARLLVAGAMLGVRIYVDHIHDGERPVQVGQGLLAWDGAWYRSLVESGYAGVDQEGIRFFPGFVLLGRILDAVLPGGAGVALVVLANAAALLAMALLLRLVREVTGDAYLAGRAVWLTACFPPAFVLVWGYAEALFLLLAVATFLALSRRNWWWAAAIAAAAAATRPTGGLLAVAALASVWPGWDASPARERVARTAAVFGGPVGFGAFVWWASALVDKPFAPLVVQRELRGDPVDPLRRLIAGIGELFGPDALGDGLHIPFAMAFVVLAGVAFRRLPLGHAAFAAACLVAALAADNLNSLERYALNGFPIVVALAVLAGSSRLRRLVPVISALGMVSLTVLAVMGEYVP